MWSLNGLVLAQPRPALWTDTPYCKADPLLKVCFLGVLVTQE